MSVPTWDQYMAPSLHVLSDGEVYRARQIVEASADRLGLTDEQRLILIPSGQAQYQNRGGLGVVVLGGSEHATHLERSFRECASAHGDR